MKKINSIHFGDKMIALAIIVGVILPLIKWFIKGTWDIPLTLTGVAIIIVFLIIFAVEMKQDNGKIPYYIKHLKETIPYDENNQYPVIKASICTGEKVAGFRDKTGNGFVEVMVIHNDYEKELFMKAYNLKDIKSEY